MKEKAVQEQVDRFLRHLQDEKNYSENTIAAYRNDLRKLLMLLDEITKGSVGSWTEIDRQHLRMYGKFLEEQGYALSTVARKVASVKSFFSFLVDAGHITENRALILTAPKVEKQLPRILSVEDVNALLAEPAKAKTPKALRDRALLELLYATGMRVSEVIALELDDLDVSETHVFSVGREKKTRKVPLTPRAFEAVSAFLNHGRDALLRGRVESKLFVNQRGRPLTRQGLWLIIKSYAESARLGSNVTPHTLRHSCAAHRLERGTELQRVRELLGHANISTTQIYSEIVNPVGTNPESDAT
jgi:integrase/recombinase XerD